jgi:hypothetical protein
LLFGIRISYTNIMGSAQGATRNPESNMQTLWYWLTRYMVAVEWDGTRKVHWARNADDALQWMACYPADAVVMVGKRGTLLAARY